MHICTQLYAHACIYHILYTGVGSFASGGGDGTVSFWDGGNRKRLAQLPGFPTSISALAFRYVCIECIVL